MKGLRMMQDRRRKQMEQRGLHILQSKITDPLEPLKPVPQIDGIYHAYDDGKIRVSREYRVAVTDIVKYRYLPKAVKREWKKEVLECYWLFSPDSDYFIKALGLDDEETHWFARTHDGGWFEFRSDFWCHNAGRLDVTGELYKMAHDKHEIEFADKIQESHLNSIGVNY